MKLTIVGAGSSYTPEIIDGLLGQACFGTLEVALYDLPEGMKRTQIVCDMALRMAAKRGVRADIHVAEQLDQALEGSDFVVSPIVRGFTRINFSRASLAKLAIS